MTEVELPDGVIAEFPDEMSESDIKSVLRKKFPVEPQAPIVEPPSTLRAPTAVTAPRTFMSGRIAGDPEFEMFSRKQTEPGTFEELQQGVPSKAGVTPAVIPSGERIAASPAFQAIRPFIGAAGIVAPKAATTVASSVAKTGLGIGEYLSSPQGITELVLSMTPARLVVLGKWAKDMAEGAGAESGTLSTLVNKPDKTPEDWQAISDHTINTLAMVFGAGHTAAKVKSGIGQIAKDLNMPEGKFKVEDRGDVAQGIFNEFEARRQAEAGSPFTLLEPPSSPISMEMRTQPALSRVVQPPIPAPGGIPMKGVPPALARPGQVLPTFEPSRIPMGGELAPPSEVGAVRPPTPIAPGARPVRATTQVRLAGEAAQRAADFEKALAERVSQEQQAPAHPDKPLTANQLRIIQESLTNEILSGQIGRERPGVISGGALEAWADKVFQDAKNQNLRFSGGDTKMIAAGVVKAAALMERGIIDVAQWTAAMVKEFGDSIRPFLNDIRSQAEQLRLSAQKEQQAPAREGSAQAGMGEPSMPPGVLDVREQRRQDASNEPQPPKILSRARELFKTKNKTSVDSRVQALSDEFYEKLLKTKPRTEKDIESSEYLNDMASKYYPDPVARVNMLRAITNPTSSSWDVTGFARRLLGREQVDYYTKAGKDLFDTQQKELDRNQEAFQAALKEPAEARVADPLLSKSPGETTAQELMSLPDTEARKFFEGNQARGNATQADSVLAGMKLTEKDVPELTRLRDEAQVKAIEAIRSGNADGQIAGMGRVVWLNGAIEGAKKAGPNFNSLIERLEALKFSAKGGTHELHALRPDILQRVGRQIWNDAIDLAIFTIRSGKSIAEAIDAALAHIRKTRTGIDEAPMRAELQRILGPETSETPAAQPAATPPPVPAAAPVDPITGEPAKIVSAKEAKAMESKVKIPAGADVKKLTEQIDLFNREIGDALESGGQFLPKELRPDVAKGAPAEKGTVTNKAINQYFVNKLSSIRKQMQAARNRIAQQADIESQVYFDTLQKRFETAFRQVQELRRASSEALYFWNKIRAEYQDIARAAGAMPEMKKQKPIIDQIWKDFRDGQPGQAISHAVDYFRMNLFTAGSWTLDFGTNLIASAAKIPAWGIMDLGAMATGRAPTRMFSAIRALQNGMRNWNPLGKRYRLPDAIESELGTTAGGEFGGRGREVFVDFSEILRDRPELADKLRHIDKVIGAPVRMKRAVDSFFGRFGAAAELYNRAYIEGKSRGLSGDELKTFVEEFVQNPSDAAINRAVKTGKELKFNRDLTRWEETFSGNILTKLVIEAFPRWTLQFIRWGGEMIGADPVFFKDLVTGKATPEQAVNYLTKAATGWGGIYAFNQLAYDNIDPNSMEYVKEDGNRVRLSGRTPAPELFFICAMLRGDSENAKAALQHLSLPGAKLLSGDAGVLGPLFDTIKRAIEGRYTAEQTARELTKLVNDAIPGKSVFGLIRAIYDPTVREGIGAPIPGVASQLPQRINPTTGEPLAPKTRIPGTSIELPTVGGTPFPGAERVLNDVESALLDHGLGLTRPRRTSIIDLPAEDVPKEMRREYEKLAGRYVQEFIGAEIKEPDFKSLPFDVRREVLQQLLSAARQVARADMAEKHGAAGESIESVPLNVQRLPKRLRQ